MVEKKPFKYRVTTPEGITLQTDDAELVLTLLKAKMETPPAAPTREIRTLAGYINTAKGEHPFFDLGDRYMVETPSFKRGILKERVNKISNFLRENPSFHDRKVLAEKVEIAPIPTQYALFILISLGRVRRVKRGRSYLYQTTFQEPVKIERHSESIAVINDRSKRILEKERKENIRLSKEKRDFR